MWKHNSRPTVFSLCVDDFGVKYYSTEDVQHLVNAIEKQYTCKVDWSGKNFLGLHLNWNYDKNYVDISMPEYVSNALKRLQHTIKVHPQYSPHQHDSIRYSAQQERQYAMKDDTSPHLLPKDVKHVQSIVGTFLYYARAIDSTMLPALAQIAQQQAQPTQNTMKKYQQLMDYAATYNSASIGYHASDMLLEVDSDASYLVLPKARSRYAGYFRLLDKEDTPNRSIHNGAVLIECKTIRHVVSSAVEAETKGVFENAKKVIAMRHLLTDMGHPQKQTIINTDNTTTVGFVNKNIQLKKSKSWDMNFHWLRDKELQNQIKVSWEKGKNNHADYFTKHHAITHHRKIRPIYIRDKIENSFEILRGLKKV